MTEHPNVESEVIWYRGSTVLTNKQTGLLALKGDTLSFTDATGKVAFELPASKVRSFNISQKTVGISYAEKLPYKLYFQFTKNSGQRLLGTLMIASPVGVALSSNAQKKAGIDAWIQAFQARDIKVKNYMHTLNTITVVGYSIIAVSAVVLFLAITFFAHH